MTDEDITTAFNIIIEVREKGTLADTTQIVQAMKTLQKATQRQIDKRKHMSMPNLPKQRLNKILRHKDGKAIDRTLQENRVYVEFASFMASADLFGDEFVAAEPARVPMQNRKTDAESIGQMGGSVPKRRQPDPIHL